MSSGRGLFRSRRGARARACIRPACVPTAIQDAYEAPDDFESVIAHQGEYPSPENNFVSPKKSVRVRFFLFINFKIIIQFNPQLREKVFDKDAPIVPGPCYKTVKSNF